MTSSSPVIFIAIDGYGGSGKSTFADMLSKEIGAEIIHIDDFTGAGSSDDWYKVIITRVFKPITQGAKTLTYTPAKWWEEHNPEPVVDQRITPIMILEGVGSLRKELAPFLSAGVFVDTPREVCLERGLERDRGMDGKTDKQITEQWNTWLNADDRYFEMDNPKATAKYVVDGTKPFEEIISNIAKDLRA